MTDAWSPILAAGLTAGLGGLVLWLNARRADKRVEKGDTSKAEVAQSEAMNAQMQILFDTFDDLLGTSKKSLGECSDELKRCRDASEQLGNTMVALQDEARASIAAIRTEAKSALAELRKQKTP